MSQHTPGPWMVTLDECKIVRVQDDHTTVLVAYLERGFDTQRANACLIAAAPELLEACHRVVEALYPEAEQAAGDDEEHPIIEEHREIINQCRAAIAKAEGQK